VWSTITDGDHRGAEGTPYTVRLGAWEGCCGPSSGQRSCSHSGENRQGRGGSPNTLSATLPQWEKSGVCRRVPPCTRCNASSRGPNEPVGTGKQTARGDSRRWRLCQASANHTASGPRNEMENTRRVTTAVTRPLLRDASHGQRVAVGGQPASSVGAARTCSTRLGTERARQRRCRPCHRIQQPHQSPLILGSLSMCVARAERTCLASAALACWAARPGGGDRGSGQTPPTTSSTVGAANRGHRNVDGG